MKKAVLFLMGLSFFNNFLFAGGAAMDSPYNQIQLRIINLTDNDIMFYYNDLGRATGTFKPNEQYTTMKHPINIDYPGVIAIKYNVYDYRKSYTEIYHYFLSSEYRDLWTFTVVVKEGFVGFIYGDLDQDYDYNDESIYTQPPSNRWDKITLDDKTITIEVENKSTEDKQFDVRLFNIYGEARKEERKEARINWMLSYDEKYIFRVNETIYLLKTPYLYIDGVTQGNNTTLEYIYLQNRDRRNIKVILQNNGYELIYYD
jgi:hypothetical protein